MAYRAQSFSLRGGLDQVTPYLELAPGQMIEGVNYIPLPRGGYRRVGGYAPYDGSDDPSLNALGGAVPGEGPIRGVWEFNRNIYAIRDDATEGKLYRATPTGWDEIDLGSAIRYDNGQQIIPEGDTITGGTSGATAIVRRVVYSGGLTDNNDSYGILVIDTISGTFVDNEELSGGAGVLALADGAVFANSLPKGGRYIFRNYNFFANDGAERMYGVSGVGPAFEFDGTFFVPIEHGLGAEYPTTVIGQKNHLMLGYARGSVFSSSLGEPTSFNVLTGAAEIGVGDEVTAFHLLPGGALGIGCRDTFQILYGDDAATWQVQQFADHGVRRYTMAEVGGSVLALDDRGVQQVGTTPDFGDFVSNTLSENISPELLFALTVSSATASVISKTYSEYRIFFGSVGFYFVFSKNRFVGIGKVQLDDDVNVACSGELANGQEIILFGGTSGFVHRMDRTNLHNGVASPGFMRLSFNHVGAPTQRKRYRRATLDMEASGDLVELVGKADFDFAVARGSVNTDIIGRQSGGRGSWDFSTWDNFRWSTPYRTEATVEITGVGTNMSLLIYSPGEEETGHAIYGVTIHYSPKRLIR